MTILLPVDKKMQVSQKIRRLYHKHSTVSLLNISTSNNEDTRKAATHEVACKSDIQYGNWWDEPNLPGEGRHSSA